jgi:hypothetical protein
MRGSVRLRSDTRVRRSTRHSGNLQFCDRSAGDGAQFDRSGRNAVRSRQHHCAIFHRSRNNRPVGDRGAAVDHAAPDRRRAADTRAASPQALKAGALGYLVKPFEQADLTRVSPSLQRCWSTSPPFLHWPSRSPATPVLFSCPASYCLSLGLQLCALTISGRAPGRCCNGFRLARRPRWPGTNVLPKPARRGGSQRWPEQRLAHCGGHRPCGARRLSFVRGLQPRLSVSSESTARPSAGSG